MKRGNRILGVMSSATSRPNPTGADMTFGIAYADDIDHAERVL